MKLGSTADVLNNKTAVTRLKYAVPAISNAKPQKPYHKNGKLYRPVKIH